MTKDQLKKLSPLILSWNDFTPFIDKAYYWLVDLVSGKSGRVLLEKDRATLTGNQIFWLRRLPDWLEQDTAAIRAISCGDSTNIALGWRTAAPPGSLSYDAATIPLWWTSSHYDGWSQRRRHSTVCSINSRFLFYRIPEEIDIQNQLSLLSFNDYPQRVINL